MEVISEGRENREGCLSEMRFELEELIRDESIHAGLATIMKVINYNVHY
jgi:hypothetical protein